MGSLGTGEILFIAIAALVVFGPRRLPEIARTIGELLAKTRAATQSVTSALEKEYDDIAAPLHDLKQDYDSTVKGLTDAVSDVAGFSVDMTSPPKVRPKNRDVVNGPDTDAPLDTPNAASLPGEPEPRTDDESPPDAEGRAETAP